MESRLCAEIVRELRQEARRTSERRLVQELNQLAKTWNEVREKLKEIEQRSELEQRPTTGGGSKALRRNGKF